MVSVELVALADRAVEELDLDVVGLRAPRATIAVDRALGAELGAPSSAVDAVDVHAVPRRRATRAFHAARSRARAWSSRRPGRRPWRAVGS